MHPKVWLQPKSVGGARSHRRSVAMAVLLLLVQAVLPTGPAVAAPTSATGQPTLPINPHTHLQLGVMPKESTTPQANAATVGRAHLSYFGGAVVATARVEQVLYGATPPEFEPEVWRTQTPSVSSFFGGVLNSPYVDWLTEYNTPPPPGGTGQTIGRGAFDRQWYITPSPNNAGVAGAPNGADWLLIDDSNIQSELVGQILAGQLPAPTSNTIYAIYFPAMRQISLQGAGGAVYSGLEFCAYHGTIAFPTANIRYIVMPDFGLGSGNDVGCGHAGTEFGNVTSVSSHELIETITDADIGLANGLSSPLAWYDPNNGEIGDICNQMQGVVTGGDGVVYVVQTEFSNVANTCIVTRPVAPSFSLSASPASVSLVVGSSGTSTIATTTTSGSPQTIQLSVAGAPSGASVALNPSSVTSGQSARLTINAGSAAAGSYVLTITAVSGSTTHATTLALTVTGFQRPAATSWGRPRIDLGTLRPGGTITDNWFDGSAWHLGPLGSPGVPLTSGPALSTWPQTNRLDVFALDGAGKLWDAEFNGSAWLPWQAFPWAMFTGSPAAVSWGPGRIDVALRGTDGNVDDVWFGGSSWNLGQLGNPGVPITSSPAVASWGVGRLDVFVIDASGQLWDRTFNGTAWLPWTAVPVGTFSGDPAAVSWGPGRIDVSARGTDGNVYDVWYDGAWHLGSLGTPGVPLASSPAVSTWGPGRLDIFVLDASGTLRHRWIDGATWQPWEAVSPT